MMLSQWLKRLGGVVLTAVALAWPARAESAVSASDLLSETIQRWADVIDSPPDHAARTLVARVTVTKAEGLPRQIEGATADVAYQGPDRLRASTTVHGQEYVVGRNGQSLWVHEPGKKFGVVGTHDVPRFKADPTSIDDVEMKPFTLPISRWQLKTMSWLMNAELLQPEKVDGVDCDVLSLTPKAAAGQTLGVADLRLTVWVRQDNGLPARVAASDGRRIDVQVDVAGARLMEAWPDEQWNLQPAEGDKVEHVALSHLLKFIAVAPRILSQHIPTLGPATGERKVVAVSGKGRLEEIDGTQVLFLKGTPRQMGKQHGQLLGAQARDLVDRVLYGVGVGSSFERGSWFFGDIENAVERFGKFVDPRYLAESDALAKAAGVHPQEARLANFFPEMFHCSGFSLYGKATRDGRMYHGRILDYMRGIGLEQNAAVIIHQPDEGYAWVNLGYAGFIGSVTAMNEKGISIGEMGGKGYGNWDGKPMAQLMREVMEKAATLDEAVEIMRKGPRTCEYYYVISDGAAKKAIGIAATADTFETIQPGQSHPRLPHGIEDAVLMSAGGRYEELAKRVQAGYGSFDADSARELMTRPVCMTSNIQSVLFAPDTLDFWVANADGENVASATRFTHYNLADLLKSEVPAAAAAR